MHIGGGNVHSTNNASSELLEVAGNTIISGSLRLGLDASSSLFKLQVDGSVFASGNLTTNGSIDTAGNLAVTGTLTVKDSVHLLRNVTIGDITQANQSISTESIVVDIRGKVLTRDFLQIGETHTDNENLSDRLLVFGHATVTGHIALVDNDDSLTQFEMQTINGSLNILSRGHAVVQITHDYLFAPNALLTNIAANKLNVTSEFEQHTIIASDASNATIEVQSYAPTGFAQLQLSTSDGTSFSIKNNAAGELLVTKNDFDILSASEQLVDVQSDLLQAVAIKSKSKLGVLALVGFCADIG